jgi:hypothetical protein
MAQADLFCEAPVIDGRYTWQEGTSAGGNPFYRLLDRGEETRWWVRHRLNCRTTTRVWFIVTDFGAYIGGEFENSNDAKAALIDIKHGRT